MGNVTESGFKEVTPLADARERLLAAVDPHGRTDRLPLSAAEGRTLSAPVHARRDVPDYDRAAMDGFAVRASDTFGASDRSPEVLRRGEPGDAVEPGSAVRVHTGSELPPGANAVVVVEHTTETDTDLTIFDAVAEGENVANSGEDVEADQRLFERGHRLRPSDLGLLKATGIDDVDAFQRPTVGVVPTGEELVQQNPDPGEVVETNGLTVSRFVERWGGKATYRNTVTDARPALRAAIERDLTKDLVVTTGGSSVGERDLVPAVVAEIGDLLIHGVALKPGHPVALGIVSDTPVLMLPGYPVACIVNAVQFLRPALKMAGGMPVPDHPTVDARLKRKIPSEPGIRTFARVKFDREAGEEADVPVAVPTRASGAGVLSSVALADGWVQVPESAEGIPAGDTVGVEDWEYYN